MGFAQRGETWLSVTFLVTLIVLIVPLPTFLLDMFLAMNLASAILLLLVTLNANRPLDVSVFPSMLLLMTLFRLALNVATTRLILLNGDAGKIVDTFGDLVVGGNLIVGFVIFLILVSIQFIVITKGATRISEVNARFTLDAMPGKQMAIDAELNVGAIDEKQAKKRREDLAAESEFYGAMDGASKYVRGDAIAGLVIMGVNILGGVMLAMTEGQSLAEAVKLYTILTIGDGLVSQVPALIIATSAGILVTKSSSDSNLGEEIGQQISMGRRAMLTGAAILGLMVFVPGLPKIPFLIMSACLFLTMSKRKEPTEQEAEPDNEEPANEVSPDEQNLEDFIQLDRILIEIGAGLIHLVQPKKGKGIVERVATLRRDIGKQFGIWVPSVRIRDNLQMEVLEYRFSICGRPVGEGRIQPNDYLAINPGGVNAELDGTETTDPAFGLPAIWIGEGSRRRAEISGYTVVDAQTVLITHLGEVIKKHAHELLSREDMQKMLDKLKAVAPTIVADVKPDGLRPGTLHQLLINLLQESVAISSLEKIIESAAHHNNESKTVQDLTEKVRADLGPLIVQQFLDSNGRVRVILLDPKLEHRLRQESDGHMIAMQPNHLAKLVEKFKQAWELSTMKNEPAAVLVDSSLRNAMRQSIKRSLPSISVISYSEIPPELLIEPVTIVRKDEVFELQNETDTQPEPSAANPGSDVAAA